MSQKQLLSKIYSSLYQSFGPQYWWPAKTKFEVIVGAILTQNTNWLNVEKALLNLKKANVLNPNSLHTLSQTQLAKLIKPAGYFNIKAKRLKNFLSFFMAEYQGSIARMKKEEVGTLREKLLNVNGIGPETADSILLYALDKPVFVVDAYTKRFLARHKIVSPDSDYHEIQNIFTANQRSNLKLFNEYHALIVNLGKHYCRPKARCETCPLSFLNQNPKTRFVSAN